MKCETHNQYWFDLGGCPECRKISQSKFSLNEKVVTPLGIGEITGVDMPNHDCWRWIVWLPDKPDSPINPGCFWPNEVKKAQ